MISEASLNQEIKTNDDSKAIKGLAWKRMADHARRKKIEVIRKNLDLLLIKKLEASFWNLRIEDVQDPRKPDETWKKVAEVIKTMKKPQQLNLSLQWMQVPITDLGIQKLSHEIKRLFSLQSLHINLPR